MADQTGQSSSAGGGGDPTPNPLPVNPSSGTSNVLDNNSLQAMFDNQMKVLRQELQQALKKQEEDLGNRLSHHVVEDKKRTAVALVNEKTRTLRKEMLMKEGGLSEAQAADVLQHESEPSTTVVAQPQRRQNFRTEDIGLFDGTREDLQFWIDRVTSLHEKSADPMWRDPLLDILPLCLRDAAAEWYQGLDKSERSELAKSWEKWVELLGSYFGSTNLELRKMADSRTWNPRTEDISRYYQSKKRLLKQAYPTKTELQLIDDIRDGLPSHLRMFIRTQRTRLPTTLALLTELISMEPDFKEALGLSKKEGSTGSAVRQSTGKSRDSGARSDEKPRLGASWPKGLDIKATYHPKHYFKRGKREFYKVPDHPVEIERTRGCATCGGPHLDAGHDWHMKNDKKSSPTKVKKEPAFWFEGYPCYEVDTQDSEVMVIDDDDDDSEFTDADESMHGSSSTGVTSAENTPSPKSKKAKN